MQILITVALAAVAAIQTPRSPRASAVRVGAGPVRHRRRHIDVATVGRVRLLVSTRRRSAAASIRRRPSPARRARLTQLVLHRWVRLEQEGATRDVHNATSRM
jgi:hypothetical protein